MPRTLRPLTLLFLSFAATSCIGAPEEDVDSSSEAVVVCARGTTVHGIDVSQWQGTIDWARVAAAGKRFAFIRASHGTLEDTQFDRNWRLARANGVLRGAYEYFSPGGDPVAQADIVIRRMGTLHDDDLPPVLDVEETDGVSAATLARKIGQWVDRVESRTGRTPIVYTGKYFWNDHVSTTAYRRLPLWIAAWGPPCPDTPMGWGGWRFWQYSSTGRVSGISGNVDLDVFDGTLAELRAFAHGPVPRFSATYVAQSFPLAARGAQSVPLDGDVAAWIELRNTGSETWNDHTRLALTEPRDRTSPIAAADWVAPNRPAAVSGTVAPGGTFRFRFTVHGARLGDFTEHFGVVQEGVSWFSAAGEGGPPDSQLQGIFRVVAPDAGVARQDAGVAPVVEHDAGASVEDGDAEARVRDAGLAPVPPPSVPSMGMDGGCSVASGSRSTPGYGLGVLFALAITGAGTRRLRRRCQRRRSPLP